MTKDDIAVLRIIRYRLPENDRFYIAKLESIIVRAEAEVARG